MSDEENGGKPPQGKVVMIIVCWLLGCFGIHRMMMGYSNWWIQLITCGGCGIWTLVDFIQIIMGNMKMADGQDLT
jgi:TM2 domain-containing membrane protein YozV